MELLINDGHVVVVSYNKFSLRCGDEIFLQAAIILIPIAHSSGTHIWECVVLRLDVSNDNHKSVR